MPTEQEIKDARIKAQQYAELSGEPYVEPFPDAIVEEIAPVIDEKKELSNEELVKMLNERAGIQLNSLEDLKPQPTEDEIRAAKEKREADKLAFGLGTGRFKKEEYDAFQQAQADKLGIIKTEIAAKIQAAYPELTEDQVAEKVAIYTGANLEDDVLRAEREAELLQLADNKLQSQFKNIINLDTDFEQHEQGITNKANFENKVKAALPVYQKDLSTVLSGLSVIEVPVNDLKNPENNHTVKLSFSEDDLKEVEDAFLDPDQIIRHVKEGYTPDKIKGEAEMVLIKKHFARLVSQGAKDYNSAQKEKYLNGRKGLMPGNTTIDIANDNLSKGNEQVYQELIDSSDEKQT